MYDRELRCILIGDCETSPPRKVGDKQLPVWGQMHSIMSRFKSRAGESNKRAQAAVSAAEELRKRKRGGQSDAVKIDSDLTSCDEDDDAEQNLPDDNGNRQLKRMRFYTSVFSHPADLETIMNWSRRAVLRIQSTSRTLLRNVLRRRFRGEA